MDQPHYEFERARHSRAYSFVSEGKKGSIRKRVQFDLIRDGMFNLGFGDWKDGESGFDDLAITDNGDMVMVLSTVIRITINFLTQNPTATVFLTGSTAARTRLYRIIISNYYEMIANEFMIWGYLSNHLYCFEKNVNYEAFLVSKLL